MRTSLKVSAAATAALIAVACALHWPRAPRLNAFDLENVPVFARGELPPEKYGDGIQSFTTPNHSPVTILQSDRGMINIQTRDGRSGWVFEQWVEK